MLVRYSKREQEEVKIIILKIPKISSWENDNYSFDPSSADSLPGGGGWVVMLISWETATHWEYINYQWAKNQQMERNHRERSKDFHFAQITKHEGRYFPKRKQKLDWLG